MELREVPLMCSKELMVIANMRTPEWVIQCYQAPLVVDQVVLVRDLHWESHLVQNLDLREAPLVRCQGGGLLVMKMELR